MQNVVATFDHLSNARLATERLVEAGIPRDQIHFQPEPGAAFRAHAGPSQPRPGKPGYREQGVFESIGSFFANLFESHTDESGIYAEALRRGTCLLLVQARDADEARHAVDVMEHAGAVSLEDRVGQWRLEGWERPGQQGSQGAQRA
ncbi:hypothetical protein ACT80S_07030 [Ramlibacter sp. MAHUQ-53]|uniref:hypothetical protein n=1 Tax=unclassified Ramlibacter TaxID=2617605 RepID=UPI003627339B